FPAGVGFPCPPTAPGRSARMTVAPEERNFSPWRWFLRNLPEATAALPAVLATAGQPPDPAVLKANVRRLRRDLRKALGRMPDPVPLNAETTDSVDAGSYTRHRVVYDTERHMSVPAYLLVPHDRERSGRPGPA